MEVVGRPPDAELRVFEASLSGVDIFLGSAPSSVDERIYYSDVVVRASFVSASNDILTFRAIEYLKGSGPTDFTVQAATVGRNASWDDREAILFLGAPESEGASGASGSSGTLGFSHLWSLRLYQGDLPEGYTVDTRSPLWMPAATSSGGATGLSGEASTNPAYIIESASPSGDPNPAITLEDLRSAIAWQQGGQGIEDYDHCVKVVVDHHRYFRDYEAYYGHPWRNYETLVTLSSGETGAVVTAFRRVGTPSWRAITGADAAHFRQRNVFDDPQIAEYEHWENIEAARPLSSGTYSFTTTAQGPEYQPCNFFPSIAKIHWGVTVTPPPNTLYEAFFDPVTLASGVGTDSYNGVLKPTTFSMDGTSTSITGLKWDNNSVVLSLSPHASLAGHKLDFIDLDGSVNLALEISSATEDTTAGTLTWSVSDQPWQDGDILMLRISTLTVTPDPTPVPTAEPTPVPEPTPTPEPTPEASSSVTVTLSPRQGDYLSYTNITIDWTDPDACDSRYLVGVYSGSGGGIIRDMGFHPAPATSTLTSETRWIWGYITDQNWWARVTCAPADGLDWRVVGETRIQLRPPGRTLAARATVCNPTPRSF